MRALILAAAGLLALASPAAQADHRHHRHVWGPAVGVTYGYPYWGTYRTFPYYWGPSYGIGVQLGTRYPARRVRSARAESNPLAFKLYVYPAAGQSAAQTADDRYECHVWAADASGHDPTLGAGRRADAESYTRAFTACMEGRDYVVK